MIRRHRFRAATFGALAALCSTFAVPAAADTVTDTEHGAGGDDIRFATFNASMYRPTEGGLLTDLSAGDNAQIRAAAEVIQRTRPDVLLVNEFDHDETGTALELFQDNYLSVGQNGAEPISYPHTFTAASNTGVASGVDLDGNGTAVTEPGTPGYAEDAFGYGLFPGQYGMAVFSRHPIDTDAIRTFQTFRWVDMPGALLPTDPETGESFYSEEALEVFRLSSKSHWDVPIQVSRGRTVHLLAAHPTPPVFDGPERRNLRRNHDEIRFWADYVTPGRGHYIYDDAGRTGGLRPGARFVIAGDLNADPYDGDGHPDAVRQLLESPRVNDRVVPASAGGVGAAETQGGANLEHTGDPAHDTADFGDPPGNLRVDYVLPSRALPVRDAGVYWPTSDEEAWQAVTAASDHRLVWVDVR